MLAILGHHFFTNGIAKDLLLKLRIIYKALVPPQGVDSCARYNSSKWMSIIHKFCVDIILFKPEYNNNALLFGARGRLAELHLSPVNWHNCTNSDDLLSNSLFYVTRYLKLPVCFRKKKGSFYLITYFCFQRNGLSWYEILEVLCLYLKRKMSDSYKFISYGGTYIFDQTVL